MQHNHIQVLVPVPSKDEFSRGIAYFLQAKAVCHVPAAMQLCNQLFESNRVLLLSQE